MKEVWMFANWKPLDDTAKNNIFACNVTDIVLGVIIGGSNGELQVSINRNKLIESAKWLRQNNIRIHLMYWVVNNVKFIDKLIYSIASDLDACKAANILITSVMYDAEKDWHSGTSTARNKCIDMLRAYQMEQDDMKFGVTGLARLHKTVEPLLKICHYGLPQAYAVWFPSSQANDDHWSHSLNTEPVTIIGIAHKTWGCHDKPLVMGLANYWLNRPAAFGHAKMSEMDNLQLCIDECKNRGYQAVAYWSVNHAKRPVIQNFISSLLSIDTADNNETSIAETAQWLLHNLGFDIGKSGPNHDGVDGVWGIKSDMALTRFRLNNGIISVGPATSYDLCMLFNAYRKQ